MQRVSLVEGSTVVSFAGVGRSSPTRDWCVCNVLGCGQTASWGDGPRKGHEEGEDTEAADQVRAEEQRAVVCQVPSHVQVYADPGAAWPEAFLIILTQVLWPPVSVLSARRRVERLGL